MNIFRQLTFSAVDDLPDPLSPTTHQVALISSVVTVNSQLVSMATYVRVVGRHDIRAAIR